MEPVDHPPGHEIERHNREIEQQYADAEWTPASVIALVLIALPFVAFGIRILSQRPVPVGGKTTFSDGQRVTIDTPSIDTYFGGNSRGSPLREFSSTARGSQ